MAAEAQDFATALEQRFHADTGAPWAQSEGAVGDFLLALWLAGTPPHTADTSATLDELRACRERLQIEHLTGAVLLRFAPLDHPDRERAEQRMTAAQEQEAALREVLGALDGDGLQLHHSEEP